MTYETEVVYLTCRGLRMRAPAASPLGLRYHRADRYSYEFQTACGKPYADPRDRSSVLLSGMRRDTADLIADPCRRCWP